MKLLHSFLGGLAGAVTLTATHQLLQKFITNAPRMDLLGEEALEKMTDKMDVVVDDDTLYNVTLAGDIAGNTLYYSLAGIGSNKHTCTRGSLLGVAAGIGGVILPKYLGLNNKHSDKTLETKLLTVGLYTLSGAVAGSIIKCLGKKRV